VSHGTFVCLTCSGTHRSLGVHISFIRSATMDTWNPKQKRMLQVGGNAKCKAFFDEQDISSMELKEKYHTRAAASYRERIRALSEGQDPPPPPPKGLGKISELAPKKDTTSRSVSPMQSDSDSASRRDTKRSGSVDNDGQRTNGSARGFGNPNFAQPQESRDAWSSTITGWFTAAQDVAGRAYQKAQEEGVWDSVTSAVRNGAQWVGDKGKTVVETARDESFWQTAGESVQRSASVITDKLSEIKSTVWTDEKASSDQPNSSSRGDEAASYLQSVSSGKLTGFGPDSAPPADQPPVLSSIRSTGPAQRLDSKTETNSTQRPSDLGVPNTSKSGSVPNSSAVDGLWEDDHDDLQSWNPTEFKKATVRKP